jgi:hypothetical protein
MAGRRKKLSMAKYPRGCRHLRGWRCPPPVEAMEKQMLAATVKNMAHIGALST